MVIASRLTELVPGSPARHGALTVIPLHERSRRASTPYLTLDDALARGAVEVTEVGQGGAVPIVDVRVSGDRLVLLVHGEILHGGKQTRMLNASVLCPPGHAATRVPVSCVERGRWSGGSCLTRSGIVGASSLRRATTARVDRSHAAPDALATAATSSQTEVWRLVERSLDDTQSSSDTSSILDAYRSCATELAHAIGAIEPRLLDSGTAVGTIALVHEQLLALDVFGDPATFARMVRKLLLGYAIDALGSTRVRTVDRATDTASAALTSIASAPLRRLCSPGVGIQHQIEGSNMRGAALEHAGQLVHLAAFPG